MSGEVSSSHLRIPFRIAAVSAIGWVVMRHQFTCWRCVLVGMGFVALSAAGSGQQPEDPSAKKPSPTDSPTATVRLNDLELPLVFSDNFEQGRERWTTTDDAAWELRTLERGSVLALNRRFSDYKPPFRSPLNVALANDLGLSDFVLTVEVRNTADTGAHRDCCIFFSHQSPAKFYYAHLGAKPDPASGQIMIVHEKDRTPLSKNERDFPWTDGWHRVKLTRDSRSGEIAVYFDDMDAAVMTASDKTFERGRLGIGSFDDQNEFDNVRIYGR